MWGMQTHVHYLGPALFGRTIYPPCVQVISTAQAHDKDLRITGRLVKIASQTVIASASPEKVENPQLPSGEQLMKKKKKFQNVVAWCSERQAEGASTLIHLGAP